MEQTMKNPGLSELDELCVQTIRFLAMEGVQKANSGHPGMPMGMASAAYKLWMEHMNYSPSNPKWLGRDRFVLSAGHGSMLLYSLLYMTGFEEMTLEELQSFRQWGSKTPGHPEYGHTAGVEVTTGPLGQGIANAVGMGIAQKYLAARYNKPEFKPFDYKMYVIAGDGCLQEGVSGEASSLAGHLGLDNVVVIYDDNKITIDGETDLSFTEDVKKRYEAYGWKVIEVGGDGNDMAAFDKAIAEAKATVGQPIMIKFRSHIGFGSPNFQDTHTAHGAPLGDDEIKLIKEKFGWDADASFVVPNEALDNMRGAVTKGEELEAAYSKGMADYAAKYPELAAEIEDIKNNKISVNLDELLPEFEVGKSIATRQASGAVLNAVMPSIPTAMGGSADLTPSNNTHFAGAVDFQKDSYEGRYIRYGVREHGMGSIMNGIAVSGLIPYGGTFMVFCDYMRPAMRVAALSGYPSIFVLTHDSIGLGEDGPTHQPVEHMASLRAIPNLVAFRPADANETAQAWKWALENRTAPVALALTRQGLPVLDQDKYGKAAEGVAKGAYVLVKQDNPDVVLLATGSEVTLVLEAAEKLAADGVKAQVVSMPSWELFEKQDAAYKEAVIPSGVKARVAVEAGVEQGWGKYLGTDGIFIGMSSFGASAPFKTCYEKFGITTDAVVDAAKKLCK